MIGNILLPLPFTRHEGDRFSKKTGDSTIGFTWAVTAGSGRRRKRKEEKKVWCPMDPLTSPILSVPG